MDGSELRSLRLRLGLSAVELADALGVDEAAVRRWEQGMDTIRPARVSQIAGLLRQEHLNRALLRQLSLVRTNLRSAKIVRDMRLAELSEKAIEHYRLTRGIDTSDHPGRSFGWHEEQVGTTQLFEFVSDRIIDLDEIVCARVHVNARGCGTVCEIEPLHTDEARGFVMYRECYYDAAKTAEILIEQVEVIPLADPTRLFLLFRQEPRDSATSTALRASARAGPPLPGSLRPEHGALP